MYNTWSSWNSSPALNYSSYRPPGMIRGSLHNHRSNRGVRHPGNQNIRHFNMGPVSQASDMPPPRMMGPPQFIGIRRPVNNFQRPAFHSRGGAPLLNRLPQPPVRPPALGIQPHFSLQHNQRRQSWPIRKRQITNSPNRRGGRGVASKRIKMGDRRKSGPNKRKPVKKSNTPQKTRRRTKSLTELDPSDPLNIHSLIEESEKRARLGQPPQSGDSTFNTPCVSEAGDNYSTMCILSPLDANTSSPPPSTSTQDLQTSQPVVLDKEKLIQRFPYKSRFQGYQRGRGGRRGIGYKYGRRHGKHQPVTGNYQNYYSRRDPRYRLDIMCDWFTGKDVLDYGCNNGTFTLMLLEKFPDVRKLDAMDCDGELIQIARHMLREKVRREAVRSVKDDGVPSVDYDKVNFQTGDWLVSNSLEDVESPEYDVIMAFSVSKWIHLNHGDTGLNRFFRLVFNRLRPGGHFIIEPQPKKSYKRSIQLPIHQTNCNSIRIDPSNLEPVLADLGFCYFEHIDMPKRNEPFRRRILLCTKASGHTPIPIRDCAVKKAHQWTSYDIPMTLSNRNAPPAVEYPTPSSSYYSPAGPFVTSPPLVTGGAFVTSTTPDVSSGSVSKTLTEEPQEGVVSSAQDVYSPNEAAVESTMHSPDSSGGGNDVEDAEAAEMGSFEEADSASLNCVVDALVHDGQHLRTD